MTDWFSSDHHFGHRNVIEYCKRPFKDVDDMNEMMIAKWNAVVKPEDTVWYLGDFALDERIAPIMAKRLVGKKYLIPGNHDSCHPRRHKYVKKQFRFYNDFVVLEWKTLLLDGTLMTHMPPTDYEDPRYPEWRPDPAKFGLILHGHVHERWLTKKVGDCVCINVGVDQWDFAPVKLDTLLDLWAKETAS